MKRKSSFHKNMIITATSFMSAIVLVVYASIIYNAMSQGKHVHWMDFTSPFMGEQVKDIVAFIESVFIHIIQFCIDTLRELLNR